MDSHLWGKYTSPALGEIAAEPRSVVVIPVGSIEQHAHHLPVETDSRIVWRIAETAVEEARQEVPALLTPLFSIGCSEHHMTFPGTLSIDEETFVRALAEIGRSVTRHGFRRLFFLNGHGGNDAPLRLVVNRIRHETHGQVVVGAASYWRFIQDEVTKLRKSAPGGISHSGEFETAAMLAIDAGSVDMGRASKFLPRWSNEYFMPGWYVPSKIHLGFHLSDISKTGVVGDPTVASAEQGQAFLEAAGKAVAAFLVAFAGWEFDTLYDAL